MNLADPDLELIDPTPNIHTLFIHFDKLFFWTKLASRAVVRWSKRMYSCAGICSYDRGGLCDIALSEPLLKLRPRKDLVETLLHEMIHAYLFITNRDRDRDGHGPNFQAHMHRINKAAGLNISIYHDFHEEVELYQNHWWRCNGPCQFKKPHFGIVRRSMNRAPGPSDYWWDCHRRHCGGTFLKIKEPEKPVKKKAAPKPIGDITKYITNNKDKEIGKKSVLKDSNKNTIKSNLVTKSNNSNTVVITIKNNVVFNPKVVKSPEVFRGNRHIINGRSRTSSDGVLETVRNVWANKQLPIKKSDSSAKSSNTNKHKAEDINISSPPTKIKKIDDYFKGNVTSVLKDLYGKDYIIKEIDNNSKRLSVIPVDSDLVNCPICNNKISSKEINKHLDECLNKDLIKNMCNDPINPVSTYITNNINSKDKCTTTNNEFEQCNKIKTEPHTNHESKTTEANIKKDNEKHKNNIFLVPKKEKIENIYSDNIPHIKIEPGTSKDGNLSGFNCPCCDKTVHNKTVDEHFDECLAFFDNDVTIPTQGCSKNIETIVLDDDINDESLTLNATGTKSPCPCCLKMIEISVMNDHLDKCLS